MPDMVLEKTKPYTIKDTSALKLVIKNAVADKETKVILLNTVDDLIDTLLDTLGKNARLKEELAKFQVKDEVKENTSE